MQKTQFQNIAWLHRAYERWAKVTWSQWDTSDVTGRVRFQSFPCSLRAAPFFVILPSFRANELARRLVDTKFILLKLNVFFRTNKTDNNRTTCIFLNYYSSNSVLHKINLCTSPLFYTRDWLSLVIQRYNSWRFDRTIKLTLVLYIFVLYPIKLIDVINLLFIISKAVTLQDILATTFYAISALVWLAASPQH